MVISMDLVKKYLENARELNRLKSEQEKLRPLVLDELSENDREDVIVTESSRIEYDHELIYDWIKKTYPELVDTVTKDVLDWDKFVSLVHLQKIDFQKMPDYCDPRTVIKSIRERKVKYETD
jgi:3-methyladenine DNA glycosylase AlkD